MKRSVGLIVLAEFQVDGITAIRAILQKRGKYDYEKKRPESYPNCLQVTSHGNLLEGESFYDGLVRRVRQELGERFSREIMTEGLLSVRMVQEEIGDDKNIQTFGCLVEETVIEMIRLHASSGGLIQVSKEDVEKLTPISTTMKEGGLEHHSITALLQDEINAVQAAFKILT